MNNTTPKPMTANREIPLSVVSGWVMLPAVIGLFLGAALLFIYGITLAAKGGPFVWVVPVAGVLGFLLAVVTSIGFFALQPNEARVLVLFGGYKGTARQPGFWWGNPFYSNSSGAGAAAEIGKAPATPGRTKLSRYKFSLRARNFNSERLKVNDKRGNPVEIAAVVVWRVHDTAQAAFDVDDLESYVRVQSESAIRHLASSYAYDQGEEQEVTLLSGVEEVSQALRAELQARLEKAGVQVEEARLTHLAYAPEIAQAMLRRQQAEAVIAARSKIVQGAVSMVDMALRELANKQVVQLDDERRAAMVSNLMVVLCAESEVHPVVNTGTLYS